jgi:hypothetical protein
MQTGMLSHLHKWIVRFMKKHERGDLSNAIWLSMPA